MAAQDVYCGIPVEPPSTSTGTGNLLYTIGFANLPVPLSEVTTTLTPLTVDGTGALIPGDPIDLTSYRTNGENQISIIANSLPSGSYRLKVGFTDTNGREFRVSGIDPVIRICDGADTSGHSDFT